MICHPSQDNTSLNQLETSSSHSTHKTAVPSGGKHSRNCSESKAKVILTGWAATEHYTKLPVLWSASPSKDSSPQVLIKFYPKYSWRGVKRSFKPSFVNLNCKNFPAPQLAANPLIFTSRSLLNMILNDKKCSVMGNKHQNSQLKKCHSLGSLNQSWRQEKKGHEKPDRSHPLGPQRALKEKVSYEGNMDLFFQIMIFVEILENC